MILIPCLLLAAFPAGALFPQMATRMSAPGRVGLNRSEGDKSNAEKQSQPGRQESHGQAASGDESGTSKEKPATTTSSA
jgi:hypothetical protein